jgi:putative permease
MISKKMDSQNNNVVIHFNKAVLFLLLKWFLVLLLFGLAVTFIISIKILLISFIVAILFVYLLEPFVFMVEAYGFKRIWSIFIVLASLVIIVAIGTIFLLPGISSEFQTISNNLQTNQHTNHSSEINTTTENNILSVRHGLLQGISNYIRHTLDELIRESMHMLYEFVHVVSIIFTIPVFTFFLLMDGRKWKKVFIERVPNRYFEMTLSVVHKINKQIGVYIRGQIFDALIVGVLSIIALNLLNVRFATHIGILAGCANIIPHFGPICGAVPAIFITIMDNGSLSKSIFITLSFIAIQLFDYLFISHKLVKSVHLHPIIVVALVIIGGHIMGIIGMFLSLIVFCVLKIIITELRWGFTHYYIFKQPSKYPSE